MMSDVELEIRNLVTIPSIVVAQGKIYQSLG